MACIRWMQRTMGCLRAVVQHFHLCRRQRSRAMQTAGGLGTAPLHLNPIQRRPSTCRQRIKPLIGPQRPPGSRDPRRALSSQRGHPGSSHRSSYERWYALEGRPPGRRGLAASAAAMASPPRHHKLIPGCGFLVDGFRHAGHPSAKAYFLSHAHSGALHQAAFAGSSAATACRPVALGLPLLPYRLAPTATLYPIPPHLQTTTLG